MTLKSLTSVEFAIGCTLLSTHVRKAIVVSDPEPKKRESTKLNDLQLLCAFLVEDMTLTRLPKRAKYSEIQHHWSYNTQVDV